jgi:hypothetical protein
MNPLQRGIVRHLRSLVILLILCLIIVQKSTAETEPSYFNYNKNRPFALNLGLGWGLSNQPLKNITGNDPTGGLTLGGSLGYFLNKRLSVDFGPTVWIEGSDLFQNNQPGNESPANKRMLVSLGGTYCFSQLFPLSIRFGGGIGTLVYTPKNSTVAVDGFNRSETEYLNGWAATGSILYRFRLYEKIELLPSLNFWYNHLDQPKIAYESVIDRKSGSWTSDFRMILSVRF